LALCFFIGIELAIGANDLLEDVIGVGVPDEGFWILIMEGDAVLDGQLRRRPAAAERGLRTTTVSS
jgi:hypothetical protein